MEKRSAHVSFVIVDIERYGRRADDDQRWLRDQMYGVLREAVRKAGVDWAACETQDRGDSVILFVPASVPKIEITETFVEGLDRELTRYNRRSAESVRMRMRVALHAGEVSRDERGWIGTELNTACRMVDLQRARDVLAANPAANLVLVVSDLWFTSVVKQDPVLVDHFRFTRVPFVAKEVDSHAWVHVRGGHVAAAQPEAAAPAPVAPEPVAPQPVAGAVQPAQPVQPAPAGGITIGGHVRMRDAVQGPQTNHYHGEGHR
ncbi:hypothetical protein [Saccharothrix hoggarensis]|uniref:Guanylate cyclase domain-containing protein n=1 Tax=Saccharothrix hoggarensis TaxID=913853 RepID=A0ABW3R3B6_9PSEU